MFESETLDERPDRIKVTRRRFWDTTDQNEIISRATARARDVLSRDLLRDLPDKPGVYLMKDAEGEVIYVGKAKNLHDRVSSYYSEPLGYTRKMDGLAESIARIDHIVTGSELEALLLESRLIKKYLPRYNRAMRNYEAYPFIKIDLAERFPRVQSSREVLDDGARYFGPFQSRKAVEAALKVVEQMFPVRNCTHDFEPSKKRKPSRPPCLRLYTDKCPGPCVGQVADPEHEKYLKVIEEVINFLSGEKEAVLDEIWRRINKAVTERDFEKAATLRDALSQTQMVIASQKYLARAVERNHALICLPSVTEGALELLCIFAGRLGRQIKVSRQATTDEISGLLHTTWQELAEREVQLSATQPGWGKKGGRIIGQEAVDEINIISRWIYSHSHDPGIFFITPEQATDQQFWFATVANIFKRAG
jgi:excinuclease UvrABC nuclease subunit